MSKTHNMSPRHFEIHALICANIYFILLSADGSLIFHTVVSRWQPYILLGFLFNQRIIFINCHKPKQIPMLHYQLVAIYMSKGLIKTASVINSHSNSHFPTPTLHTHTRTHTAHKLNKISNINSLLIISTI